MNIKISVKSTTMQDIYMKLNLLINIGTSYIPTNFHVDASSRSDLISIFLTHILRHENSSFKTIYFRCHSWISKLAFLDSEMCLLSPHVDTLSGKFKRHYLYF